MSQFGIGGWNPWAIPDNQQSVQGLGIFPTGFNPNQNGLNPSANQGAIAPTVAGDQGGAAMWDALHTAYNSGDIDINTLNGLASQLNTTDMPWDEFNDHLSAAIQQGRNSNAYKQSQDALNTYKTQGTADLNKYEQSGNDYYNNQISRFHGINTTPGGLRSDAEFGTMLANQEGAINAQVNSAQLQDSRNQAARGIQSSGKAQSKAMLTGMAGAQANASNYGDLSKYAIGQENSLRQGQTDFLGDLASRRGSLNSGIFGANQGLANYSDPNFGNVFKSGTGTTADLRGLNAGFSMANQGSATQAILGAAGLGMQGMQMIGGMFNKK